MAHPRANSEPNFFWQGLFILLPVVALALAGFISVRQDKLLAEAEARAQANTLADALAADFASVFDPTGFATNAPPLAESLARFWASPMEPSQEPLLHLAESYQPHFPMLPLVTDSPGRIRVFRTASDPPEQLALIDQEGNLIYPPPLRDAPLPNPSIPATLGLEQSNLWSEVRAAEFIQRDFVKASAACERLLNTDLPKKFAGDVIYEAGMALGQTGQWGEALKPFARAAREYPGDLSETGIPLRQLALWQIANILSEHPGAAESLPANWLATTPDAKGIPPAEQLRLAWNQLCAECIIHPTLLSEHLLSLAPPPAGPAWLQVWESHQTSRAIFELWRNSPAAHGKDSRPESCRWLGDEWLVWRVKNGATNELLLAQRASWALGLARGMIQSYQQKHRAPMPAYFGVGFNLAGRNLLSCTNTFSPLAARDDSQVALLPGRDRPSPFKLEIYLADAATFYAHQRERAQIFGALNGTATLAALLGFFAARRAFHRQLHLSEMKSNFVSSVSHELRAPIASMRLMAEGLERGRIQGEAKRQEYFRFIAQECRRLSSLIENVLDWSRIEQGRKQYELESTDLTELARQTVKLMETSAVEPQIEIALQMSGDATPVEVDGKAIQQALINLIDNAIKHSPKGAGIKVGLEFEPGRIQLWVEDQGEGIPAAEHGRIFERFYRLGSELRRETQGVGIGLSIVKHIVEAHGGRVFVRSAPGEGSRFTIELPVKPQSPVQESKEGNH